MLLKRGKCLPFVLIHQMLFSCSFFLCSLEDDKRRNGLLERDVDRFKERERYISEMMVIAKKLLWVVG